jgi:hypothetical protein
MYFDTVMGNEQIANSSASIVFGYSFLGSLYCLSNWNLQLVPDDNFSRDAMPLETLIEGSKCRYGDHEQFNMVLVLNNVFIIGLVQMTD